jgi:hypothetical protein
MPTKKQPARRLTGGSSPRGSSPRKKTATVAASVGKKKQQAARDKHYHALEKNAVRIAQNLLAHVVGEERIKKDYPKENLDVIS